MGAGDYPGRRGTTRGAAELPRAPPNNPERERTAAGLQQSQGATQAVRATVPSQRGGGYLKIQTRWTMKFTVVAMPWAITKPTNWATPTPHQASSIG